MEHLKLILEEPEEQAGQIALVRLVKDIPDYEFFYLLNKHNRFCFERIDDLVLEGSYFTYSFVVFRGYCRESKVCFHFFGNRSVQSVQKKISDVLFPDEQETSWLMPLHPDADYILFTPDTYADFSVILLPENLCFQRQDLFLSADDSLYQIIQYYE